MLHHPGRSTPCSEGVRGETSPAHAILSPVPSLRPINATTPAQSAAIRAIEPSYDKHHGSEHTLYYPCAVTLADGTVRERAYCNHFARYSDAGDWINPERVTAIRESPHRLPIAIARTLYSAGESGMGYLLYKLHFRRKPDLVIVGDNFYLDFPDLPPDYDIRDAVGVTPHAGREETNKPGGYRTSIKAPVIDFIFHDDPRMTNA